MMRDVHVAGGRIEVRRFRSADEIAALPERLVFNCTGLGSRELVGDDDLIPVRGQLAVLEPQSEVGYAVLGDFGYMFPRPDGIILGGTFERGIWDTTPQPLDVSRIIASHRKFFDGFRCTA
jgi:glycine/D-amino acid oxidase-like deaminating enzyme